MTRALVKFVDGLQFVGTADSGHAIVMDGTADVGGGNTGMRPMELVLVGLGGCSGMDVVSILRKKKQPFRSLEVNIKGEKAENYPKGYKEIEIEFIVKGKGLEDAAVKRAVELSMEKYCSVKASLNANISFGYKIIED